MVGTDTVSPICHTAVEACYVKPENGVGARLKIKRRKGDSGKQRSVVSYSNLLHGGAWGCFNSSVNTLVHCLLERIFFVKDGPDGCYCIPARASYKYINTTLSRTKSSLIQRLLKLKPWSPAEYVASLRPQKQKLYLRALENVLKMGYLIAWSIVTTFVKFEKHFTKAVCGESISKVIQGLGASCVNQLYVPTIGNVPRAIQPRSPEYNICLGRYLKRAEHSIYSAIDSLFRGPTVRKGYNALETGQILKEKWDQFDDPVYIGIDASRFDQHTGEHMLQFEHDIYLWIFDYDPELALMLKHQRITHGVGRVPDGKGNYTQIGGRCSGDVNTSLGNIVIMCVCIFELLHERLRAKFAFVNDGDDGGIFTERRYLKAIMSQLPDFFWKLGYNMVVEEPVFEFERIVFCQCQPVFDACGQAVMCRQLKSLGKSALTLKDVSNKRSFDLMRNSMGQCGLSISGDLPVYGAYYDALCRNAGARLTPQEVSGLMFMAQRMDKKRVEPTPESRYSFYLAFDVTPDEQVALEQHYDQVQVVYGTPSAVDIFTEIPTLSNIITSKHVAG